MPASKKPNPLAVAAAPSADDRKYRAEDALRTIARAHEHMADKSLMRDVKALAERNVKAVSAPKGKRGK